MFGLNLKVVAMKFTALLFFALGLTACGSSSSSSVDSAGGEITRTLIDSPINGVNYLCDGKPDITKNNGQFNCKSGPVTFRIGGLTLGTITNFNDDKQVFPQDFSAVGRDNFTDAKSLKLARLLQSFDDDGDISTAIDIPSSIGAKFTTVQNIDDLTLSQIAKIAGVDLVSEAYAISHLRRTLAGGAGHSNYRIQVDLTDATPNKSITTDVVLTIKGAEVFSGDKQLGNTMTLNGLFKKVTLHLKNPPETGQDIKIITRAKGYIDSGASIALSPERTNYDLNLNLVKDAEGVIAPGIYASDMGLVDKVNDAGIVTEAITLESKEAANKPGVKITIPKDTQLTDKNGNVVKGAKLKVTSFDPYQSNAIAAYPGGLNVVADASGFNIAGQPQAGNTEVNFKSAGFVAISIADAAGKKVKNFSQDIEIAMQFAVGTKDGEGKIVAIGDEVPIWSYDEDTGKWSYEKVGTVRDLNLTDGLYDVVYKLNHLSYWNLDWYGESCNTSNFNLKGLKGNSHVANKFTFQLTIDSSPSIDRWLTTRKIDSFLSFLSVPAGFSGELKVWTRDKSTLLSTLSFLDTCSKADRELRFAYDSSTYEYEEALRVIDGLNSRSDKLVGVSPILDSIQFVFTAIEILNVEGNERDSDDLFSKVTAVILEYSHAFIEAEGYVGVTFNEYGCDPAHQFYVQELTDNFYHQTSFNGSLASEYKITVFPYIQTAARGFLDFSPTQLGYSPYGIREYVRCGLSHVFEMIDFGDETGYKTIAFAHIETVILANLASIKNDIQTELANNGKISASSAATFDFTIRGAVQGANLLAFAGDVFYTTVLTATDAEQAYLDELKATGKVTNPCGGESCPS